jgi:predicted HicB family RNase H-like nuclease
VIQYSEEDGCFVGHVAGIVDIVGFHGESARELRAAFRETVDDYLSACAKTGKKPQKPLSGKLLLRVPPEVHSRALVEAEVAGKSLNQWATKVPAKAICAA